MKIKTIDEMQDELQKWNFLQILPKQIGDFNLEKPFRKVDSEIVVASYNGPNDCVLEICYTQETGDFVVIKNVGLFRFRDDRYYSCDKEEFVSRFLPNLANELAEISKGIVHEYPYTARSLGFDKWQEWHKLPEKYGNFHLYITPDNPLRYLNGSWVLLSYEDRVNKHQLAIFYNEYRNEIFAELKHGGVFEYTNRFDVNFEEEKYLGKKGAFLQDVIVKIDENLMSVLDELSSKKG